MVNLTVETSERVEPKQPFSLYAQTTSFGLRERERVRRLLLRRRIESWVGTMVVVLLAACAVFALLNTRVTLSDNPSIQGFRKK
jgi:hypothetical protein